MNKTNPLSRIRNIVINQGMCFVARAISQAVVQSAKADNPQFAAVIVVFPCRCTYGLIQNVHRIIWKQITSSVEIIIVSATGIIWQQPPAEPFKFSPAAPVD